MITPSRLREVLLIEDNAEDEALTLRALGNLDVTCNLQVARDGEQAIELIEGASGHAPDLILLDLKIPKRNGLEVLAAIRRSASMHRAPVVMLTSSDEPRDVFDCYEAGASAFVRKPVSYDEYLKALRVLGRFWLQLNLKPPRAKFSRS